MLTRNGTNTIHVPRNSISSGYNIPYYSKIYLQFEGVKPYVMMQTVTEIPQTHRHYEKGAIPVIKRTETGESSLRVTLGRPNNLADSNHPITVRQNNIVLFRNNSVWDATVIIEKVDLAKLHAHYRNTDEQPCEMFTLEFPIYAPVSSKDVVFPPLQDGVDISGKI